MEGERRLPRPEWEQGGVSGPPSFLKKGEVTRQFHHPPSSRGHDNNRFRRGNDNRRHNNRQHPYARHHHDHPFQKERQPTPSWASSSPSSSGVTAPEVDNDNASRSTFRSFHPPNNNPGNNRGRGRGRGRGRRNFKKILNPNPDNLEIKQKNVEEEDKCCECEVDQCSYKCPRCLLRYCSLACFKTHQRSPNCVQKESESDVHNNDICNQKMQIQIKPDGNRNGVRPEYSYPTADTIKPEGLQKLLKIESLRSQLVEMLKIQNLRERIQTLDSSNNPRKLMDTFTNDTEFSTFRKFIVENLSGELYS